MRFLIVSQYFHPEIGAPQQRLRALSRALVKRGNEVEVITALPNHPVGKVFDEYRGRWWLTEEQDGIRIHRVPVYPALGSGFKRILNYLSFAATSVVGLFKARKPDLVLVESPPFFAMPMVWLRSLFWRAPIVFNVADLWPDSIIDMDLVAADSLTAKLTRAFERWCYRRSTAVNAVTRGILMDLKEKKGVPESKLIFCPNGADTSVFFPREPDIELQEELGLLDKSVFVYAGTIGLAQGLESGIRAFGQLIEHDPQPVLVMIGDGSDRERLQRIVQNEKITNVVFLSANSPEYVARLLSFATAGFVSLRNIRLFEGARPSKLFPIMASGRPVVFAGAGESARLLEEAGAGLVAEPENVESIKSVVSRMAGGNVDIDKMGQSGLDLVRREYTWDAIVSQWLLDLESLGVIKVPQESNNGA